MEFENACSEMYYILEHLNPVDRKKIPETTIQFFRDNRSIFYKVDLDYSKNLCEENLMDETKAFIQILNEKYFKNESDSLNLYIENSIEEIQEEEKNTCEPQSLVVIKKENKFLTWLKSIFKKRYKF